VTWYSAVAGAQQFTGGYLSGRIPYELGERRSRLKEVAWSPAEARPLYDQVLLDANPARRMKHTDIFAELGVAMTNPRWSWGGVGRDGKVYVNLWADHFSEGTYSY
jgi:hypothetical protein